MSLERAGSEASLTRTRVLRRCSWRRPQLEQPKRLVYKKIIKPLMEKKRRDRIACCLNQLKTLLIDNNSQSNKPLPNSRMDKAALLEMTVQRIQALQLAVAEDRGFHTGYSYCASLVQAFLISETQRHPEAPSQSHAAFHPTCESTSRATPPPASIPEKVFSWSEKCLAFPDPRGCGRSAPSASLSRAGPQIFWRPWST
ncbi:transcription factor HES-5-like isoform X2 [Hemicordylus capensis]|uniref:transcription factor HES-5-like isoform X2 n=1 Tax=Hemicordylus capensis TaxID=884348 RepID=UPI0023045700|nr:transcription factor HES-5-like isoform X2 [Hemicordylus capensis]